MYEFTYWSKDGSLPVAEVVANHLGFHSGALGLHTLRLASNTENQSTQKPPGFGCLRWSALADFVTVKHNNVSSDFFQVALIWAPIPVKSQFQVIQ